MNERIKQLAEQAKQYAREQMSHSMDPLMFSAEVFQTKFAELIVQECISMAQSYPSQNEEYAAGIDSVRDRIKDFFGVNE